MPEASPELRAEMGRLFGDPIDDKGPINLLTSRGYTLRRDWYWEKPGVTSPDQMARDEYDCMVFLAEEWDFGGLVAKPAEG